MPFDKNTKLITLNKVTIGGEEFLMTTKEKEEWEKKQKKLEQTIKNRIPKSKYNFELKKHRTLW